MEKRFEVGTVFSYVNIRGRKNSGFRILRLKNIWKCCVNSGKSEMEERGDES